MKKPARRRPLKVTPFDPAEYLRDEKTQLAYLNEVLAEGDPTALVTALGTVARARGMSRIARSTGLGRESLYKALSKNGNPAFGTIVNVAAALGFSFAVQLSEPPPTQRPHRVAGTCRSNS